MLIPKAESRWGSISLRVQAQSRRARREATARTLGVSFATAPPAEFDADLVFHASGTAKGLASALAVAGFEATIVELSWYGDREVSVPLGLEFHPKRLRLISSQVSHVSHARRPRRDRAARLALALQLLCDQRYDVLLSGEAPFAVLPDTMRELAAGFGPLCHIAKHDEAEA